MLKDPNLMHKTSKNLLFGIGLVIVLIGALILGWQNRNKVIAELRQDKPAAEEEIISSTEDSLALKPLRPIDETDHVWGDVAAPVKIIVYDDFECTFCADYYDTLEKVKTDFAGKVTIAFRHFPLIDIHPTALSAALASECAAEQDKFWEMYGKLFADNKALNLNPDQFKKDAEAIGLNKEQFEQCMTSEKYKDKVLAQAQEGKESNVTGTPTTFINGEMVIGNNPYEDVIAEDGSRLEGLKNIITRHLPK